MKFVERATWEYWGRCWLIGQIYYQPVPLIFYFSRDTVSYQRVDAHYKATYFKIDNWNAVTKGLTQDEIWKINETFLIQQVRQGKVILFSHDPIRARPGSFFKREVDFLRDLGYKFKQINKWSWEALR